MGEERDDGEIARRIAAAPDRSLAGLRRVRRTLSRELRARGGREVLRLVEGLLERRASVPRWFAWELAHHHRGALAQLTAANLNRLGAELDNWGDVDAFSVYLLGPAYREGRISADELARWARSKDRWRRRAAVVSTVALNNTARGGIGDAPRTLAVCDLVLDDRDDLVVKALSWALRELAVKRPQAVEGYLAAHAERLAARVSREVRSKLTTGLKQKKRR